MKLEDEIKSKFSSEAQKAMLNVLFTYSWINGIQTRHFKKFGITPQQFNVLRILRGQNPKPASVKLIAERMIDKNSNASRLVDKLVDKGLVDRRSCPDDRRQVDIFITKKGLKMAEDGATVPSDQRLNNLSEEESKTLNTLLDKMRG